MKKCVTCGELKIISSYFDECAKCRGKKKKMKRIIKDEREEYVY